MAQGQEIEKHVLKLFIRIILQGKLRQVVYWVTGHYKGGILTTTAKDVNIEQPVEDSIM